MNKFISARQKIFQHPKPARCFSSLSFAGLRLKHHHQTEKALKSSRLSILNPIGGSMILQPTSLTSPKPALGSSAQHSLSHRAGSHFSKINRFQFDFQPKMISPSFKKKNNFFNNQENKIRFPRSSNWNPFSTARDSEAYDKERFQNRMGEKEMADKRFPKELSSSEKALNMLTKSHEVGTEGNEHKAIITGYNHQAFKINESTIYPAPIVAFPRHVFFWNIPEKFSDLTVDHFKVVELILPEVQTILVGTGDETYQISNKISEYFFQQRGIVVESMRTGAACNIFNTMNAEDRLVALFAIPSDEFRP